MDVILIRHGESEHNTKLSNSLDSPLTKLGVQQACMLSKFLYNWEKPKLRGFMSPYLRTIQTAEIIEQYTGIVFKPELNCREYHIDKNHIDLEDGGIHLPCGFIRNENLESFINRVKVFAENIKENCVIVSHGAPIRVIANVLTGVDTDYLVKRYASEQTACGHDDQIRNCTMIHITEGKILWRDLDEITYRMA